MFGYILVLLPYIYNILFFYYLPITLSLLKHSVDRHNIISFEERGNAPLNFFPLMENSSKIFTLFCAC